MTGTLINIVAVLIGSAIGMIVGNRLTTRMQESVMTGLGLTTLVIGLGNAGKSGNIIVPLLSVAIGVIAGEMLDLDGALKRFGGWLQLKTTGRTGEAEALNPAAGQPADEIDPAT